MKAVLLMAGTSSRLKPLTDVIHKSMLEIGDGKTMLELELDVLVKAGVDEFGLVVGHGADYVKRKVGNSYRGIPIAYFYNPFYEFTGAAYSLWLTKDWIQNEDSIIIEADHVIDERLVNKLVRFSVGNVVLADSSSMELGEETQVVGRNGFVDYFAWSRDGNLQHHVRREDCRGEAVFFLKLSPWGSNIVGEEVDKYVRECYGNLEIVSPINNALHRILCRYIDVEGLPWIEVDTHEDMERARKEVYPRMMK